MHETCPCQKRMDHCPHLLPTAPSPEQKYLLLLSWQKYGADAVGQGVVSTTVRVTDALSGGDAPSNTQKSTTNFVPSAAMVLMPQPCRPLTEK